MTLTVSLSGFFPLAAQAATFNIADGDVVALIAAINTANGNSEADTINLASGGTYTLTAIDNADNGLPIINSDIDIIGNGATIQRSSDAGTPDFRIFRIGSGNVALIEVTVKGGKKSLGNAGGILNFATLTLINSIIANNTAFNFAGGIYNVGTTMLIDTTVSNNATIGGNLTGGGGGIYSEGTMMLIGTTVSSNATLGRGGAIYNLDQTMTLINSTVSGNTALNGGGIFNRYGAVDLVHVTTFDNTATDQGGGIWNLGGIISLKNTILANNGPSDCSGTITTLGHNLFENPGACSVIGSGTGDIGGVASMLDYLADNGGPTQTHAPLPGSPVIDAVPLADCTDADSNPVTTDQRGVARPQGLDCDIGAHESGTGAAWVQLGADIDGEAGGDESGSSVSMSADGNRMAIGAPGNDDNGPNSGHVRVYEWSAGSWVQLGADIDGEAAGDVSGWSVSMSADGNRVAIGGWKNVINGSFSGHVRVYTWTGSDWVQLGADIDSEAAGDRSGFWVSMSADGNRVAIGAFGNAGNGSFSGHVRVHSWSGTAWVQLGADIDGEAANDNSGWSVSMSADGNRLAIGAIGNDGNGSSSGHVRVYSWSGAAWVQLGADIDGEAAGDQSGWSVSMSADGNQLAIGATENDGNGPSSGHVRVFTWTGATWVQLGSDIDGEAGSDGSGFLVSMSAEGNQLAIGAWLNDGNGFDSGHVRVYTWTGAVWTQLGADIDGEAAGDHSGWSVAMFADGNRVAIGAPGNDDNGSDSGHVRVYEFEFEVTGAALDALTGFETRTLANDGTGFFTDSHLLFGVGFEPSVYDLALGDLDGDGDLDAFIAMFQLPNEVWINDGVGNFTKSAQVNLDAVSHHSHEVALGDLDGDGDLDAFVANGATHEGNRVWLNSENGDPPGVFSDSGQIIVTSDTRSEGDDVDLGDLDGDGDLDAFIAIKIDPPGSGISTVWLNGENGDPPGVFSNTGQRLGTRRSQNVALGDFDGDGAMDALISHTEPNEMWLNDGAGNFHNSGQSLGYARPPGSTPNIYSTEMAVGDLNGDGHLDAVMITYRGPTYIYLNDGDGFGTLTSIPELAGSDTAYDLALGDLNGDGFLDLFLARGTRPSRVWFNDGLANFTDSGQILGSPRFPIHHVALGDLDGDSVLNVSEAIAAIVFMVDDLGLEAGLANALEAKLANALSSFQAGNSNAAVGQLTAFINLVEAIRGTFLSDAEADALIAVAQAMIDAINDGSAG